MVNFVVFLQKKIMSEKLCILNFNTVEEAVEFAKEINPESTAYETMLDENRGDEDWLCVLAVCDICNRQSIFFASAEIYEDEITAVECKECGNMSVYPKEGNFEDE